MNWNDEDFFIKWGTRIYMTLVIVLVLLLLLKFLM
jgi:hypothetical protein